MVKQPLNRVLFTKALPRDAFQCSRSTISGWQTFARECHEHIFHDGIHKFPQHIMRIPAAPVSPHAEVFGFLLESPGSVLVSHASRLHGFVLPPDMRSNINLDVVRVTCHFGGRVRPAFGNA